MRKYNLFLSLLMVMFFSVGNVWAGQVTISPSQALNDGGVDPIAISCAKGDGTSNPAISSGQLRLYQAGSGKTTGNTITFSSSKSITSIVFTFANSMTASNGSFSTGSYDSNTSTWTGSTTSLTLTVTGTKSGTRIYITNMVVTYAEGGKTLSSIAVSGAPTKTAYYVGDEFDPTGLVVTGTYSDDSQAAITSGITWAYDPSQELALNQTSIGVTATVSEISSPKYNVTGLSVTAPVVSNWQATAPADLETGDAVVLTMYQNSKYYAAANNNGTSSAPAATEVAVVNSKLSNVPGETLQWTVTVDENGYQFAVGDNNLYCTNTNNGVRVGTNNNKVFTVAESDAKYYLFNSATSRYLGVYNNADWRCYTSVGANIKDGSLVIFREPASSKQAAGLAYSTSAYLVKANGALTTPTLTNPNSLSVSYASSDANVVTVNENTGALTIKSSGKAVITASSAETDTYKAGSASYTIYVAEQAGTAEDPLSETSTKALIDLGCTLTAHVNGVVASATYNSTYHNYTVYLTGGLQFYRLKDLNNADFTSDYLGAGDEVTAVGALKKYNSTYELDEGCCLTNYVEYTAPKTSIANDQANPYTVAQAITYAADGVTYDLDDYVYVQGVVYEVKNFSNGAMDIFIKDANAENQFELYKCAGINDGNATTPFDALTDVQVGDVVIGYGQLMVYNSVYEFKQGNYLVNLDREEVVLTDYYEKVTETAGITDGTYLIVYEEGSLAFNGSLETLDAANNTIEVSITNDHKIGVTQATEAATFFIDATAGSIQSASGKYIGANSYSNRLDQSEEASAYVNALSIDANGNAVISLSNASWDGDLTLRYNSATNQARFRYYKNGQQSVALYKLANETVKANPELAWSAELVEITLGETFTAPTLDNPHSVAGITYASDNEALATVTSAGVISLVADATGTAHITATFAGNDDYKAANVSCTITVNSSTPTPAETKNVVIIAEYNSKFYAMTNSLSNGALAAVEVEKDGSKIVVMAEADKAAIQWTMTDNTTTATFQDAEDKYLAHSGTGTNLALQDAAENWTWSENGYYYAVENRTFFYSNSGVFKNYSTTNLPADKTDYSGAPEIIEIAAEDIILSQKANPQLAYTPNSVTLTVGGTFTPAVLSYTEGFDGLAAVTYASNNVALATVNESGVVSLVAAATGTATITATFAGNTNYQAGSASYTITVSEAGDDLSGTWALVTDVEQLAAGKKVVIAYCGLEGNYLVAKTMGAQNTNNRAAVESSTKTATDYTSLTLGPGTKVFTLVDAGDGKFAIKASNGNYLTSATSGTSNNLLEAADYSLDNAKWTISISNEVASIVAAAGNKTVMQYNSGSTIFSCYGTASQKPVRIYMLQEDTPEPPTPEWIEVRSELTIGKHYTICLKKRITAAKGGTFWTIGKHTAHKVAYLEEAQLPLTAGEPFIFQATADKLEVVYEGEDVDNPVTAEGNALRGTFEDMDAAALAAACTNMYMLSNNQICSVTHNNGNFLSAFRAYIDDDAMIDVSSAPQPAPGRKVKSVPMQGNVATGIDDTHTSMQTTKMLIDGQLFIICGEKMYDVTGSLVK